MSPPKPPTRKKSSRPAPARKPSSKGALAAIVGADVYRVWVEMLNRLGRDGRSHRLFVLVAAMLQHAACQAQADQLARRKRGVAIAENLLDALAEAEPGGANDLLAAEIIRLFRDAKGPYVRTNRRGDEYSLVEGSIDERFARWFNMPWEEWGAPMASSPKRKKRLGTRARSPRARLDGLVAQATIDAYGDSEQRAGFFTMMEEHLDFPFETELLGMNVIVERVDLNAADEIVAVCRNGAGRQRIPILDLSIPDPVPRGAEWIAAYRHWLGVGP